MVNCNTQQIGKYCRNKVNPSRKNMNLFSHDVLSNRLLLQKIGTMYEMKPGIASLPKRKCRTIRIRQQKMTHHEKPI